jgi:hypothetical protein
MINGSFARFGSVIAWALLGLCAFGCATAANASAPGELEMVLADGAAPYTIEGRVRLVPVGSSDVTAPEVFVEVPERRTRLSLPAGVYLLTLNDGARLGCPGDETEGDEPAHREQIVAALPQRLVIAPGARTTARLGFGGLAARDANGQASARAAGDPCEGRAAASSAALALSGLAPAHDVDAEPAP